MSLLEIKVRPNFPKDVGFSTNSDYISDVVGWVFDYNPIVIELTNFDMN